MQQIMQILHEDHINVAQLLDVMDHVLERARAGDLTDLNLAYKAMRYMTAYPDIYHHPTEDAVFAVLQARAPETRSVIEQLTEEHKVIGSAGKTLLETLRTSMEQTEEPQRLLAQGPDYVVQLREHMNTEEGRVFPIIKVVLSQHDWTTLDSTIAKVSDPVFGAQIKKSYQDLARALSDTVKRGH